MVNRSIVSNPYPKDSGAREEWNAGFKKACEQLDQPKPDVPGHLTEADHAEIDVEFEARQAADAAGDVTWPKKK